MNKGRIKILTCGGTIDKIYFDAKGQYHTGEPQVINILAESNVFFEYRVESIMRKDSLDMADEDREAIRSAVANTPESMVVLTHGTDTMIETAKKLLDIPDKTIVLTGAIEPAKFKISDAPFNIGCAITAVQTLPPGVYLALNGEIFDPRYTRKNMGISRFERTR